VLVSGGEIENHAPNGHSKENPAPIVLIPLHRDRVKRKKDVGDDHLDGLLSDDERGCGCPSGAGHRSAIQVRIFGEMSRCNSTNLKEAALEFLG